MPPYSRLGIGTLVQWIGGKIVIHDHMAQEQRIESLEKSMREVAEVFRNLSQEMRFQGADGPINMMLTQAANAIERELNSNRS